MQMQVRLAQPAQPARQGWLVQFHSVGTTERASFSRIGPELQGQFRWRDTGIPGEKPPAYTSFSCPGEQATAWSQRKLGCAARRSVWQQHEAECRVTLVQPLGLGLASRCGS